VVIRDVGRAEHRPQRDAAGKRCLAVELEPEAAVVGEVVGGAGGEVNRDARLGGGVDQVLEQRAAGPRALAAGVDPECMEEEVRLGRMSGVERARGAKPSQRGAGAGQADAPRLVPERADRRRPALWRVGDRNADRPSVVARGEHGPVAVGARERSVVEALQSAPSGSGTARRDREPRGVVAEGVGEQPGGLTVQLRWERSDVDCRILAAII
jgi:hypothetical protein